MCASLVRRCVVTAGRLVGSYRARPLRPESLSSGHAGREGIGGEQCCHVRDGRVPDQSARSCSGAFVMVWVPVRAVHCGPCRVPVRATADQVRASKCSYTLYMHMGPMRTGPNPRPERYVASRGHGDLLNASIEDSEIVFSDGLP